jgi:hypothetical protein
MPVSPDPVVRAVHRHLAPAAEHIAVVERHANGAVAIETESDGWDVEPMPLPQDTPFRVMRARPYDWSDAAAAGRTVPSLALLDDGRSFDLVSVEGMAALVDAMRGRAPAAVARMVVTHHPGQPGLQFVIERETQVAEAVRERARAIVGDLTPRWTEANQLEFVSGRLIDAACRTYELRSWTVEVKPDGVLWQSRPLVGNLSEDVFQQE